MKSRPITHRRNIIAVIMWRREITYLVTSFTEDRRDIFEKHEHAEILCETLLHYRAQGFYRLHTFVVMPDHFHALLTPSGRTALKKCIQFVRGGTSHSLQQGMIWEKDFTQKEICDRSSYKNCVNDVESNPERRGLTDWQFVSSEFDVASDPMPAHLGKAGTIPRIRPKIRLGFHGPTTHGASQNPRRFRR